MQSKPIKQAVALILDTKGMEGPVTRREIAEHVMRLVVPESWSISDKYDAEFAYIQREVGVQMGELHSTEFIKRHLNIPEKYRNLLLKIPQFICISSKGGRGSEHIKTFIATREHWAANFDLKGQIVKATRTSQDASRDIRELLEATGAGCLADLLNADKTSDVAA